VLEEWFFRGANWRLETQAWSYIGSWRDVVTTKEGKDTKEECG
jgi:hypothetical protein